MASKMANAMQNIPEKLQSRKLWALIATSGLVILNELLEFGLGEDDIQMIVASAGAYMVGQGWADSAK